MKNYKFRPVSGINYKKRPIIIMGCSFAYGYSLKNEETIGFLLSELSKRPVYNYAVHGKGFQNSLYIVENGYLSKNIKKPEYVIYVMVNDHIRRMYSSVCMLDFIAQPEYKLNKKGELFLNKEYYPIYKQFCTYYFYNNLIYNYILSKCRKRNNIYINKYFLTLNNQLQKLYPGVKLVILLYGNNWSDWIDFREQENRGIKIIHTKELTETDLFQRKYWLADNDMHPNEKAWKLIAPNLKKALNL